MRSSTGAFEVLRIKKPPKMLSKQKLLALVLRALEADLTKSPTQNPKRKRGELESLSFGNGISGAGQRRDTRRRKSAKVRGSN